MQRWAMLVLATLLLSGCRTDPMLGARYATPSPAAPASATPTANATEAPRDLSDALTHLQEQRASHAPPEQLKPALQQVVDRALAARAWDVSLSSATELAALDPHSAATAERLRTARLAVGASDLEEAEAWFTESRYPASIHYAEAGLKLFLEARAPGNVTAAGYAMLAHCYGKLSERNAAISNLLLAVARDPSNARYKNELAQLGVQVDVRPGPAPAMYQEAPLSPGDYRRLPTIPGMSPSQSYMPPRGQVYVVEVDPMGHQSAPMSQNDYLMRQMPGYRPGMMDAPPPTTMTMNEMRAAGYTVVQRPVDTPTGTQHPYMDPTTYGPRPGYGPDVPGYPHPPGPSYGPQGPNYGPQGPGYGMPGPPSMPGVPGGGGYRGPSVPMPAP